ncbi:MAG TPA: DUF6588 family protein, partial [Gemmatimonadota bacterium]|nr:DUF6588 family protein [Gemmatimonadota bacterium]
LNSRWFRTARVHRPLQFDAGFVAMGSLVPSRADGFEPVLPDSVTYEGRVFREPYGSGAGLSTPTAVGTGAGIDVQPQGDYRAALVASGRDPSSASLPFPKGYDVPAVPMGLFQLRVGLPLASEVTLRGLPSIEFDRDLGRVKAFGVGVKHQFSHWMPPGFPLDLAVEGGIQTVDVGDYLSATARNVSLVASRQFSVLTLFAAGALENADVTIRYTVHNQNLPENETTLTVRDHGDRSARLTGGFSLDLFILKLTAAYSTAAYDVVSAGITFGF